MQIQAVLYVTGYVYCFSQATFEKIVFLRYKYKSIPPKKGLEFG